MFLKQNCPPSMVTFPYKSHLINLMVLVTIHPNPVIETQEFTFLGREKFTKSHK